MLKENEVKFYNQNGYLILKDKLDKNTLSDLKNSTTQLIEEFRRNLDEIINHDAFSDSTQNILFGEDAKYNRELIDENYTSVKIAAAYNKIYRYLRKEIESYKSEFI